MGKPETKVSDLCAELGITRQTLYRFVGPKGELRSDGEKLLNRRSGLPRPIDIKPECNNALNQPFEYIHCFGHKAAEPSVRAA